MNNLEEPGNCEHCGHDPKVIPLCEHLTPPTETLKPLENKVIYCPACPLRRYKWYQFMKKKGQKLSRKIPMLNTSENSYVCLFCGYGYRN